MTNPYNASAYRGAEILSASPGRLVVITFDGLLASLARARSGFQTQNFELAMTEVARARGFLGELLSSLNYERGAELSRGLSGIYVFIFSELQTLGHRPDLKRLDKNIALLRELREAFAAIASQRSTAAA